MALSQALRKILDASFAKKGVIFWLFSPILFFISFIFAYAGILRRQKGYRLFKDFYVSIPNNLHVICVGNILVGGTGKSPLVRTFATHYLENDEIVAIAARGIGAKAVIVDSFHTIKADINKLSDENREHFEILRKKFPLKQFFIFQNKNRNESLGQFAQTIAKFQNKKCVFILDDGLQHFSCPRHINICVCDLQLNLTSPPYAMPIGPYREGFGRQSVQKLLQTFDLRIWTNSDKWPLDHFQKSDTEVSIDALITRSECRTQDVFAHYQLCFVKFHIFEDGTFHFQSVVAGDFLLQKNDEPLIIAGIAHPERFLGDLQKIFLQFELCNTIFLADHGQLNEQSLNRIAQSKMIILTLKDFFRFCTNKKFLKLCATRTVYGCYPEYKVTSCSH